jgi:hypothetical protein
MTGFEPFCARVSEEVKEVYEKEFVRRESALIEVSSQEDGRRCLRERGRRVRKRRKRRQLAPRKGPMASLRVRNLSASAEERREEPGRCR